MLPSFDHWISETVPPKISNFTLYPSRFCQINGEPNGVITVVVNGKTCPFSRTAFTFAAFDPPPPSNSISTGELLDHARKSWSYKTNCPSMTRFVRP